MSNGQRLCYRSAIQTPANRAGKQGSARGRSTPRSASTAAPSTTASTASALASRVRRALYGPGAHRPTLRLPQARADRATRPPPGPSSVAEPTASGHPASDKMPAVTGFGPARPDPACRTAQSCCVKVGIVAYDSSVVCTPAVGEGMCRRSWGRGSRAPRGYDPTTPVNGPMPGRARAYAQSVGSCDSCSLSRSSPPVTFSTESQRASKRASKHAKPLWAERDSASVLD